MPVVSLGVGPAVLCLGALESRSDPRGLRQTRAAVTAREAPPRLCLLAEGGLALAAVGLQVVLFEGIEHANLLVSRRTSFILEQLNCGNPHITFLLIRLSPPQ